MWKLGMLYCLMIIAWLCCMALFDWSLMEWINYTFLVGLSSAIITVCIRIWKTGFLDLFNDGFRIMGQFLNPAAKSRSLQRANKRIAEDEDLQQFKAGIAARLFQLTLSVAIISVCLTVIGLLNYYKN
ncbi:DUF3899 domain-containing protein [Virgibacillus siamensis]|uniref:DUF3899 domain-containing protein n=1 Tax=Virgibacillus siamensis TaxID=480071 RepID=UPI00158E75D7|nr:DUF3899 domain-containing protein [Virgibacillus siamensis]